jgi:hypothetical protein
MSPKDNLINYVGADGKKLNINLKNVKMARAAKGLSIV